MRFFIFVFVLSYLQAEVPFAQQLNKIALERTKLDITYDGRYIAIPYPNGDVPKDIGVCTDVVVRSYRALGVDLQKLMHEDMKKNFTLYPKKWGLKKPDTNIDHRRVLNMRVFFTRHGKSLPVSKNPQDYKVGDLVTWYLAPNQKLPHIGIVTHKKSAKGVPLIVHNMGSGVVLEDILFTFEITGHYRFLK